MLPSLFKIQYDVKRFFINSNFHFDDIQNLKLGTYLNTFLVIILRIL